MFHIAGPEDITSGKVTDVYFDRTIRILKAKGVDPAVRAEFIAKGFPGGWPWAVFAGIEEALEVLGGLPVKVRSIREGSVFYPYEPVLEIEGKYLDFCIFETAVLGLICQASGVATSAARMRLLVEDRTLMSFGARRMHPAISPMIERSAYIGGCDGVSVIKSGELIGEDPMGTVPHSLIICFGSTVDAMKAYDEVLEEGIKRVALIDTFQDEKFECINVAEALGEKLYGVRFDTPSSRRGDFALILRECRWELDMRGYGHVKFFVSGGIKEQDVPGLNPLVAGYGVGTALSNAPVVDFSMDIIELGGKPLAKRGKRSGAKRLLCCASCGMRMTVPASDEIDVCPCGGSFRDLLGPVLDNGKRLIEPEPVQKIRERTLNNIDGLSLSAR